MLHLDELYTSIDAYMSVAVAMEQFSLILPQVGSGNLGVKKARNLITEYS